MTSLGIHIANAFLLAVALVPLLAAYAPRLGLVDFPNTRKAHDGGVPAVGGLAMFVAFLLPVLSIESVQSMPWGFFAGLSVVVIIGVIDDIYDIRPLVKLVFQMAGALTMVLPEPNLIGVGDLFGMQDPNGRVVCILFSVIFLVGIANAVNMLDGIDGLAAGTAAAALFWLAMAAIVAQRVDQTVYLVLLLFAVLGFMVFNIRHPWQRQAAAFMGDAGSTMLGVAIGFFVIKLAAGGSSASVPLPVLLWVIAVPAMDTIVLSVRRLAEGRSPMAADRRHIHHRLLDAGLSPATATAVLVSISFIWGAVGFAGWQLGLSPLALFLGLAIPFIIHVYFVTAGWTLIRQRRIGKTLETIDVYEKDAA